MTQPLPTAEGEAQEKDPKLELAQKLFLCASEQVTAGECSQLRNEILTTIQDSNMSGVYEHVCLRLKLTQDPGMLKKMKEVNATRLGELDEKIKDAETNLGETDVRDALLAKAQYLMDIGNREGATAVYEAAEAKGLSSGMKLDTVFATIRVAILYQDWPAIKALVARGKVLCEQGGDWERKNKLKVYEGLLAMATRDLAHAAAMFLDSIATFTAHELFDYTTCVFYAVVTAMVTLSRVELREKVVDSPEVLQVIQTVPHLQPYLHALYYCRYNEFFPSFVGVMERINKDLYLSQHARFYMKEMRLVAYNNFLDAYKSVTLDTMATTFNVSPEFIDRELSNFIVLGRISAKMDKVAGVIESKRPDTKNYLYQQVIKQGDLLLNRIQKLSKVIDIE